MNKNRIRLTESQLHNIIKESVKGIINEIFDDDYNGFHMGNQAGLAHKASKSLKGLLNPEYRTRKERQENLFKDYYDNYKKNREENDPYYFDTESFESGYNSGTKGHNLGTHYDSKSDYWGDNKRQDIMKWSPSDYENYDAIQQERLTESKLYKIVENTLKKMLK